MILFVKRSFIVLLLAKACCTHVVHAQPKNTEVEMQLLRAYQQLRNKPDFPVATDCNTRPQVSTDEALNLARQYNAEGKWSCCLALLIKLNNSAGKLSPKEKNHLLLAQADYYNSHQLFDSAKALATLANLQAGTNKWLPEKIQALLLLSAGALKKRNIFSAYASADSAIQLSRKSGNKFLEGRALLQMAFCARRHFTSLAHRAFPYYQQANEIAESTVDSTTLFGSNLYYADDHFEINQWPEGLPFFNKAIAIALLSHNVYMTYTAYIGVGSPLVQLGHAKEAIVLFQKSLTLSQQQHLPYNIQHSYFELSDAYYKLKQYDAALLYADSAANTVGVDSFWANAWQQKADIYKELGDYKMATAMYEKSIDWLHEDFLYRNQDQLSSYEAKLKTTEKELQVGQEKKRSLQLEWAVGGVAILLLMAAWAYLQQRRGRQQLATQNSIIEKQRMELEKSLAEKEMLLKEIHHRVKNNLTVISSLLELQASGVEDAKAKAAIAEGQNRVRSIALIHQRLYQHENLAAIELGGFTDEMIAQVSGILKKPGQKITTHVQIPETMLDIDTAVPLGLILNELLTNSFKYAFTALEEGSICIRLTKVAPGNYVLHYSDNGPGIPDGLDLKKSKSLGLRLIYRLSSQIGGSASYTCQPECAFIIPFKDANTRNEDA